MLKKQVFVTIILTLSSLVENKAQENIIINRNVEGIVLGKTIKVQAARILQGKGYHVGNKIWDFKEKPEEQPVLLQDTVMHLGTQWDAELFNSTADKRVYRFCFMKENRKIEEVDSTYTQVNLQLNNHYKQLISEQTEYNTSYNDGRTEISLWKTSDSSLRLCYQAIRFDDDE